MKLLAFRALCFCVLMFCLPAATRAAGVQWDLDGSVHPANRLSPHFRNLMVTSNATLRQLTVTNTITAGGLVVAAPTFSSFANSPHNHQDAAGGAQLNASSVFSAGTIPTARLGSGTANNTTFLRGDSTWQVPGGGGIGDFVGPASSTNNNLVSFGDNTGKLGKDSKIATDGNGSISTTGDLSVGVGSSVAGRVRLNEGTAAALVANQFSIYAGTDVAAGGLAYLLPSAASTGFLLATDAAGVMTLSHVASTGSGNVVRSTGPTLSSPTISDPIITSTLFFEGLVFTIEGAVANDFETFFSFTEPTADGTITVPTGRTGTLVLGGDTLTGDVTATLENDGSTATVIADGVSVSGWTLTTPTISGAITFPDDVTQTFNPGANNAGLNVGSIAGDPATPDNGDIWYDSTANELTARINGANVALGAGGGSDADAIHDNVAGEIAAIASKATPVAADLLLIEDSADSNNKKKITIDDIREVTPGYTLTTEYTGSMTWTDGLSAYYGWVDTAQAVSAANYNLVKFEVPKSGTVKRIWIKVSYSLTGSGETINVFARLNDTTDFGTISFAFAGTSPVHVTDSSVSQAVSAGDYLAIKVVCPTFATDPTQVRLAAMIYIE